MNKLITYISFRIIIAFSVAILMSFIPELFRDFFGDEFCRIYGYHYDMVYNTDHYHWGWRHWLFLFMGICLFIIQIIDIANHIQKYENNN